jgi:branched-chain amino acid transport system ATP-binding protein
MGSLEPACVPTLQTLSLSKSFGGLRAVHDVTLSFVRGALHAVIGPNGAGKSTFVNLIAGEIRPSSGSILLEGRDITSTPVHARAHLGIARSFQRTDIFKSLSVLENVRLAAQAVHLPGMRSYATPRMARDLEAKALSALERAGLAHAVRRTAGTLAHGQQRQLEIAMTLASDPKLVMLDEPLAGMGQEEGDRMVELLKSLARDHAVLLIEHDMDFVFKVADTMTVLVEGAILATGTPDAVRASAAVQAAYLGGA